MNNKSGFTLAEVLIALGIVGVIAAILVPAFGNSRPDKSKIMYLKAYDGLTEAMTTLVNDSNYFTALYTIETSTTGDKTADNTIDKTVTNPNKSATIKYTQDTTYYDTSYNIENYPLLDYTAPRLSAFNSATYSGKNKLCELLKASLNGKTAYACGTSGEFDKSYNFTTSVGGMRWKIEPSPNSLDDVDTSGSGSINYYNLVTVDVNGSGAPNSDTANGKVLPDRFKFYILASGKIVPADVYGQAYVANRVSMSKKAPDVSGYTAKTPTNIDGVTLSVGSSGNIASLYSSQNRVETKTWEEEVQQQASSNNTITGGINNQKPGVAQQNFSGK